MGLHVDIFRYPQGDCTNNGISKRVKGFCVENAEGPFNPCEEFPAARLVVGPYNSMRLVPVELIENKSWVMAGGNYGGCCDSRFGEAVEKMCGYRHSMIQIFDRVEN